MVLKAVLFDFNGVIINDESIHHKSLEELLLSENLSLQGRELWQVSVGQSDRTCLREILKLRGRFVTDEYLDKLVVKKASIYRQRLQQLVTLPIYPEVIQFIDKLHVSGYKLAVVTGSVRSEAELVLKQAEIDRYFDTVVTGDDISESKPDPEGYLLAVTRLNQLNSALHLLPSECLAIEDTFSGIQSAKSAGIQVVAIANTYPFHMLQRQANWTIDTLADLELDRVTEFFDKASIPAH